MLGPCDISHLVWSKSLVGSSMAVISVMGFFLIMSVKNNKKTEVCLEHQDSD